MYAADRSCINRLADARHIVEDLRHPKLGVAVDAFHVWWDPDLDEELERLGELKAVSALHLCDWRPPLQDILNDRALMGEGVIDLPGLRRKAMAAGFGGLDEIEIFSTRHWARDGDAWLADVVRAYREAC